MGMILGSSDISVPFIIDGASVVVVELGTSVGIVVMVGMVVVSLLLIDGAGIIDGTGDNDCIVVGTVTDGAFVGPPLPVLSGDSVTPSLIGAVVGLICPNGTDETLVPPSGVRVTVGSIVAEIVSGADVMLTLGTLGMVGDIAIAGALVLVMVGIFGSFIPVGTFTLVGTDGGMTVDGMFMVGIVTADGALDTIGAGVIALRVGGSSSCRSNIRSCTSASVRAHRNR